jgi:hypothetical protein
MATIVLGLKYKKKKAFFLTAGTYSFLLWLYVVARVAIDQVPLNSLFLNNVPFITFFGLGSIAFFLSIIFIYLYFTADAKPYTEQC